MKISQGVIILVVAVALSACGGPEERKAKYFARAQEHIEAGNYAKARVALRNVLKIDPKYAEGYYLFAKVEEKEKNWRNAVKLFQEVVELAPDHTGALINLAKYYLEAGLTDHVRRAAETVLKSNPHHPQARALLIAADTSRDEQVSSAIPKAEALAAQFPVEPDVAILLATLYSREGRFANAIAVLQRSSEAHPDSMDLLNILNETMMRASDMAGAETVVRRMIEAEPKSFDHRMRLSHLYDKQGLTDKAEAVLRESVTLDPESEDRRLILADFVAARRGVSAAEGVLLDAATQLPYSTKIQFGLAALYAQSKQEAKARESYEGIVTRYEKKPAALEAKVKLAELDLLAGDQAEAERRIQEVLKENPRSADGLILSGRMALARRQGKEAVQAFRTVLRDQPELATVQFLLGKAYQMAGENSLARESFERAVALYPGQIDARRSLAALETQSGRIEQARARLDDLLKQRPDDVAALEMLMMLDLITRNWAGAEQTLARLRIAAGDNYVTLMAEGRFSEAQRKLDQAGRAYERAAILAPNEPEPLVSLIKLEMVQDHPAAAQVRLETLLTTNPKHLFAHGLLGEVLTIAGHHAEADLHFREAVRIHPKWITPWLDWAGLWLSQKKPDLAVQVVQSGLQVNPESEELYMLLAAAYSEEGRIDSAIDAYDAVLRFNPRNVLAANNLAVLLVDHKADQPSLQKAFALSRDFEKDAPHPLFLDTLGWVRFKMGQQEEALRLMKTATAKLPDAAVLNYHLGMAFYRTGQTRQARSYFAKALESNENFNGRKETEQILSQMRG